jgi:hypothetical protein
VVSNVWPSCSTYAWDWNFPRASLATPISTRHGRPAVVNTHWSARD